MAAQAMRKAEPTRTLNYHWPWRRTVGPVWLFAALVCLLDVIVLAVLSDPAWPRIARLMLAFPSALSSAAILLLLVNRTRIVLDNESLTIEHGPLWWPRRVVLPRREILQLYVERRKVGWRWGPLVRLWVATRYQRCPVTWYLVGANARWADLLERQLERQLGIANRPIVCPKCGYDLRATRRRCSECGWRVSGPKRERRKWTNVIQPPRSP
jgi:hypothetical protein